MSKRNYDVTFSLTNGTQRAFNIPGEYVRLRAISVAGAGIKVKSSENDDFTLYLNQQVRFGKAGVPITPEVVYIINNTGSTVTITLLFGDGEFEAQEVSGTVAVSGNVLPLGATLDSIADVACATVATTQVLAADSTRRYALVSNPAGSGEILRAGDSGTNATNGSPINPGDTLRLDTVDAISVYNPGLGTINVSVTSVKT